MSNSIPGTDSPDNAAPNPLDESAIAAAVDSALAAIASAADLDALKDVRIAVTGEKSPLSLANRQIGGLPKDQKAAAGKVVGPARGRINQALAARTVELEADVIEIPCITCSEVIEVECDCITSVHRSLDFT